MNNRFFYAAFLIHLAGFLPLDGFSQMRSALNPTVQEIPQTVRAKAEFRPGLNVRRTGNFSGIVQDYQMQHGFEMSMVSGGGNYLSRNMYTNSQIFQFSNTMSARLDLGVSMSPFSNVPGLQQQSPQLFVRNASFEYRPNNKVSFQFSFSQDPFYQGVFSNPFNRNPGIGGF